MGMKKATATEVTPSIPPTAVETPVTQPVVEQFAIKQPVKKAVAFGRELSDYELQKDRRIGVQGVIQAIIGSDWYSQQASLTDLTNKEAVAALRKFALEEVDYWVSAIKAKSE